MIKFTQKPKEKEKIDIADLIDDMKDYYSDFYITRNNLRLMIKDNKDLFFKCLNAGDKIIWDEKMGIIFITGFSDKASRVFIRPLFKDGQSADRLIKQLNWKLPDTDLWAKIKKNSPIKNVLLLKYNNFKFVASRGKEILLCRPKIKDKKEKEK